MSANKKIFSILTILLLAAAVISPVFAQQTGPTAYLVHFDDDFELEIFDSSDEYVGEVFTGMEIKPEYTIKTYDTTAEIQLEPNGSILKLSPNSVFKVEAFQRDADESNDFTLYSGKMRLIAARAGRGYENYSIVTESSACAVKGTDFVLDSIGVLAVQDGAVEFTSLLSSETINVIGGQLADIFADTFAATAATAQSLASVFSGMNFVSADPAQVPGHTVAEATGGSDEKSASDDQPAGDEGEQTADAGSETPDEQEPGDGGQPESDPSPADDPSTEIAEEPAAGTPPAAPPVPISTGSAAASILGRTLPPPGNDDAAETAEAPSPESGDPGLFDDFFSGLGDLLAFEIGSITIDGKTYAKAVIQPEFEIGDLKMGLYLPIIYQDNLFDPSSWYKPAGNSEWSFGTDSTHADLGARLLDAVSDLFLKIKYIQYGENGDDFYLKFGNLDNMMIGHGILMYNFANNIEFPAVRKVGINTGFNFDNFAFEAVVDNAADPSIFGGRFVYIPAGPGFPLGLGLSAIADINPDSELEDTVILFDTVILNAAFDVGLPVDFLGMTLFADIAGLTLLDENGWHFETFYNSGQTEFLKALNNFGISSGAYGSLFDILDYRLEYRLSKGIFKPGFYGSSYLVNKTAYLNELKGFVANPTLEKYQNITMGVYGELSANIFDIVSLSGGYLWPLTFSDNTIDLSKEDYFHVSAMLLPDVIPVAGIYGSVSYTRTGLNTSIAQTANGQQFQFFDGKTKMTGELVYPFDEFLEIALQYTTTLSRDTNGNLRFDTNGNAEFYHAFTIDTRISF